MAAAGCAGWAGGFLAPHWLWVLVLAPAAALAVLPCRAAPAMAGYTVAGVELLHWVLGVPGDNPANIAAVLLTAFGLGRFERLAPGALSLGLLAAAMAGRDGFALPTVVFVVVVLAGTAALGFLVRRRAERAEAAGRAVAELTSTDPAERVARVVAGERARLAGETLGVIRAAVHDMRRGAEQAAADLDPAALAGIQADGRRAVGELRRLLGLLRSEPSRTDPAGADGGPVTEAYRRPRWHLDLVVAVGAAAIVSIEAVTVAAGLGWRSVALSVALCGSLALRRTDPSLACLAALLPTAAAVGWGAPLLYGFETPLLVTLLAWSVGASGRLRDYAALVAWAAVTLIDAALHSSGNEAILLAFFVAGAAAGQMWGGRRRQERVSLDAAGQLRRHLAVAADRAVRAERLRLARELHDVASHAIGVMVLQAGAAQAQRDRDPAAARVALAAVRTAGEQAVAELAVLFGLLDAGAIGAPGLAGAAPATDLGSAVATLVQRVRGGGVDVALSTRGDLSADPVPAGTAYRVVQEALTNAVRHAPGSRVTVRLSRDGAALVIDVRDDGPSSGPGTGGFGLVGLAERVRAEGGEVAAGARPDGGFAVIARLPVGAPHPVPG